MSRALPSKTAHSPDPSSPILTLFLLDLGTTGTHPSSHHIQSLALLPHPLHPSTTAASKFSSHIRPPTLSPSPHIHPFLPVWRKALSFINFHTLPSTQPLLIAHNAPFDAAFLAAEIARADPTSTSHRTLLFADSLPIARITLPYLRAACPYSQKSLAEYFAIPVERPHHAEYDVDILADILRQLDLILAAQGAALVDVLEKDAVSLDVMAMRYEHYVRPSGVDARLDADVATYFVEKNGAYYHGSSECYGLRSTSKHIERTTHPHPKLQPCPNRQCIAKQHGLQAVQSGKSATSDGRARGALTSSLDCSFVTDASTGAGASETAVSTAMRKDGALSYNSHQRDDGDRVDTAATVQRIVTTRSGRYYHADRGCHYLRKAKKLFEVGAVEPHLTPCPICWSGQRAPVDVSRPSVASSDCQEVHVITTRTGKYYHSNRDCQYLHRASEKIRVKGLPTNLAPCRKCFGSGGGGVSAGDGGSGSKVAADASEVSSVSSAASSTAVTEVVSQYCPQERKGKYITTRTGKYFHMSEDCNWLRRARGTFRVSTVPSILMACPLCCEENAKQEASGSPVSVIPAKRRSRVGEKKEKDDVGNLAEYSRALLKERYSTGDVTGYSQPVSKEKDNTGDLIEHSQPVRKKEDNTGDVTEHSQPARRKEDNTGDVTEHSQPARRKEDAGDVTESSQAVSRDKNDTGNVTEYSQAALTKEASLAPYGSESYKTRSGTKFHIDKNCRYIRGRDTFLCSPLHEEKDPCRGCALGLFQEWAMAGWTTGR